MKIFNYIIIWILKSLIAQIPKPLNSNYTLETLQSPYGEYLVDSKGRALYVFSSDCYDSCILANSPYVISKDEVPSAQNPSLDYLKIGSVIRKDNKRVLTYNNYVLFYSDKDEFPGDINNQGVRSYGGDWSLISPSGERMFFELSNANLFLMQKNNFSYISDHRGMALYSNTKNCDSACAKLFYPLKLGSDRLPSGNTGVNNSLISIDTNLVVKYNQSPLFYYVEEKLPGQIEAQAKDGIWYLVSPTGELIITNKSSYLYQYKIFVIFLFMIIY